MISITPRKIPIAKLRPNLFFASAVLSIAYVRAQQRCKITVLSMGKKTRGRRFIDCGLE